MDIFYVRYCYILYNIVLFDFENYYVREEGRVIKWFVLVDIIIEIFFV